MSEMMTQERIEPQRRIYVYKFQERELLMKNGTLFPPAQPPNPYPLQTIRIPTTI